MTRTARFALASILTLAAGTAPLAACSRAAGPATLPPILVQSGAHDGGLTVGGTATIEVAPDCADLVMTITVDAARPGDALAQVRARQAALVAAMAKLGVADKDLALSQLGIEPTYRYQDQRQILDGYRAELTITVTTRRFDQVAPLMEAGADAGATGLSARFRRSDLAALRKQVRDQALAGAQAKARETAAALGVPLGRVTAVADANQSFLYTNEYFPSASGGGGGGLGGESQPLTVDVTVTYDLPAA